MENMWSWTLKPTEMVPEKKNTLAGLQPWLDSITQRHHIHPDHRLLLENICTYLFKWQKSNKILTDAGTFRLNAIPFFPPSWFTDKQLQSHIEEGDLLAPSYFAKFIPPYRLQGDVPERWDVLFLKVNYDESTGYSYLMMVMRKAAYGNLESNLQNVIPTDYQKPRRLALSITKAVKDLHWEYIHGNVHPRNILFNFDDTIGELVDATFMQPKHSVKGPIKSITDSSTSSSSIIATPSTPPISPNDTSTSPLSKHFHFQSYINNNNNNNNNNSSSSSSNCSSNKNNMNITQSSSSSSFNHPPPPPPSLPHSNYSNIYTQRKKKKRKGTSGRWPYVAPEVAQGLTGPTTEADIYALGVIIWQLISRVTFPPNAPIDPWVFRIEPIPGVLKEWENLYMDCLAPDPQHRPSAYMVYRRLEKMNIHAPTFTPTTTPATTTTTTSAAAATTTTTTTTSSSSLASTILTPSSSSSYSSFSTLSASTSSSYNPPPLSPLPIKQETLDYIHQRRIEIDEFMKEHKNQFSSPQQRLTKIKDNVILSASVTRSVNHDLEKYPSLVHNMGNSS
ncbi:kinase-like domain-containing protein [Cunninghamella echinulata]|nr:kinase-like domain-containing protein [Cunninghamella echinulata]